MLALLFIVGCVSAKLSIFPKDWTLTETVKALGHELDSSCIILLLTPEQFRRDHSRVTKLVTEITTDFTVDMAMTALPFQNFTNLFWSYRRYLDCKSPMMLLIHDDEETRRQLIQVSQAVPMHDVVWLMYSQVEKEQWFSGIYIPFSSLFIIANEVNSSYVTLHELYRVKADAPLRAPFFGYWSQNSYFIPTTVLYNRRNNLEGILFRTGSTQNAPIHSFEENSSGELELVGYFPEVWKQLEEIINFTSVHYPSIDNVTGIKEKNGSWNGLIGMLLNDEIDVAVSEFIMDNQRSHVVDFSRPLVKTSYQIFFKYVGANYNWDAILRPFRNDAWFATLVWLVAASWILAQVHLVGCRHKLETQAQPEDFNLTNALFFHLKALSTQGHNVIPNTWATRIICLCAYIVACILVPSYSAYLISYLTFRTPKRPFDDLQGLLNDKSYKLQTNSKTAEYTYFSEATDPTLQRIYRELMAKIPVDDLPLNTRDALDRVCNDVHLAHFGDMVVAQTYIQEAKINKECNIMTLSQSISTIYSSMALRRRSPYRMVINHYLQRMEDHGLIDRTLEVTFPSDKNFVYPTTNKVELNDVMQTIILLLIGICLSVIVLLGEIIYWRLKSRKVRRHHNKKHEQRKLILNVQSSIFIN